MKKIFEIDGIKVYKIVSDGTCTECCFDTPRKKTGNCPHHIQEGCIIISDTNTDFIYEKVEE